ncbi:MAG: hypothetical protein E7318_01915 [Clostridiales bacterium]|nr:hypothetical protein [Clostridiales bacterium]
MLVIIDLEWVEGKRSRIIPTQIAAIRVDENWQVVDQYASLIKPYELSGMDWKHVAYSGAPPIAFVGAKGAHRVLTEIENWLLPTDDICWWHDESEKNYKNLIKAILKQKPTGNHHIIGNNVCGLLRDGLRNTGSPYALAKARGLMVPKPQHSSANDVEVIRLLLSATKIDHREVFTDVPQPVVISKKRIAPPTHHDVYQPGQFPFWLDLKTKIIHADQCPIIASSEAARGFGTLQYALKQHLKPCACCVQEHRKAVIERNTDIINRSQYSYVYMSNSNVFHTRNCKIIRTAYRGTLLGSIGYKACVETGRTACKVCKPTAAPDPYPPYRPPIPGRVYDGANRHMSKDEKRAYARYTTAMKERSALPSSVHLGEEERKDFLTLTHSSYAFWAGRGYSTFHRRECPKLNGLTDLRGFALYEDAIRKGLAPCKQCKPKQKDGIHVSIPITSHERSGESAAMLDSLCDASGYEHEYAPPYYYIVTPVGKWRLDVHARPVKLDHINLVRASIDWAEYHKQPRIFLSLSDTFSYIERHDRSLWAKLHPSGAPYPTDT